jgi:hypothetical protein
MGFNGYLFKVGNYEIDGYNYINYSSYNVTWNSQDLDSYRDALGVLHRNALEHKVAKIELETRENLTNDEVATFMGNIRANYTNQVERKATVTVFVPELNDYVTQEMYMSDPQFKIKRIDKNNVIKYEKTRIAFIGY